MLKLSSALLNQPVLSLRSGAPIGIATAPVINPNNLAIVGLYCKESARDKKPLVLLTQDIREWIPQGFAVDDHDSLAPPEDLVRLQSVLKINFTLLGKAVYTQNKQRLGKVSDFAVDDQSFMIQKLYVSQNIVKNLSGTGLSVDRNQIIEITDKRIVIRDPLQGVPHAATAAA